ncbi:MAG: hypothetical protein NC313_02455 [Butyrivibrio sp.]|nr:hypothetical protein [Butyrivibrio sp.]
MLKDSKIGFSIWKKLTDLRYAVIKFVLTVVAGCVAAMYVAPILYERVTEIALSLNWDGDKVIIVLALIHIVTFGIAAKGIVYRAYDRNKDLFYQLAVSKRAGCICTMLQQFNGYAYALVVLLAVCGDIVMPIYLLVLIYTLIYIVGFYIYYGKADSGDSIFNHCNHMADSGVGIYNRVATPKVYINRRATYKSRLDSASLYSILSRVGRTNYNKSSNKSKQDNAFKKYPLLEAFKITIHRLYQSKSLTAAKIILLIFIIYCGRTHMLHGILFLLADAFLILINDCYWKKESGNFQYFSEIGIPFSKYLRVHFAAGICFNIAVPLLLFLIMGGELIAAAVSFCMLSYLLIVWYMAQIYLYLNVRRDKEGIILLCEIIFLAMALLLPAGLLMLAWLYKKSACAWRENQCLR